MRRYAIQEAGVVTNIIIGPDDYQPDGIVVTPCDDQVDIGWLTTTSGFSPPSSPSSPPPAVVPETIEKWRVCAVLDARGLLTQADTLADAAGPVIRQFWRVSTTLDRHSAAMIAFAGQLGITESELDKLFIDAAAITI